MSEENTVATEEITENEVVDNSPASAPTDVETTPESQPQASTSGAEKRKNNQPKAKKTVKLSRGQEIQGKVKTITKFGAFIDIDLPQDGLVHISELSNERVEDVSKIVSVGDEVTVWVKNLDRERNRISLTMRKPFARTYDNISVGDVFDGVVTRIEQYGVFVDIDMEREGLVHVSELSYDFIKRPEDAVSVGDKVPVKVLRINKRRKQVNLSIKALLEAPESEEEEIEEVADVVEEEEVEMSTTMAAAFDMFNTNDEPRSEKEAKSARASRNATMDELIQRTLKAQEDRS